jgi:FAD/FMN-containing dehydrogenase
MQWSRLEGFLEGLLEDGLAIDALMSQSAVQEKELWTIREDLPLCLMQLSRAQRSVASAAAAAVGTAKQCIKLYKYDVSIALRDTDDVVRMIKRQMEKEIKSGCGGVAADIQLEFCCFGHAGDQNLHLNVLMHVGCDPALTLQPDAAHDHLIKVMQAMLDRTVFKAVLSVKGSVSAEHGVGQQKRQVMAVARSPAELSLMSTIKRSLDPNGILNPGKLIPDGY